MEVASERSGRESLVRLLVICLLVVGVAAESTVNQQTTSGPGGDKLQNKQAGLIIAPPQSQPVQPQPVIIESYQSYNNLVNRPPLPLARQPYYGYKTIGITRKLPVFLGGPDPQRHSNQLPNYRLRGAQQKGTEKRYFSPAVVAARPQQTLVSKQQRNLEKDQSNESGSSNSSQRSRESVSASGASLGHQRIVPSSETNGNSQVVYVNLARVVSEKNETERVISLQRKPIKLEGQIACGETNRNGVPSHVTEESSLLNNRIVGGNKADPGEFPYQVRLNVRSRRGSSLCGGVIIDKRHILTAAHCMTTCSSYYVSTSTIEPSSIQATIGDYRITSQDGEQTIGIEKVTAHQQYSACSYSHNNYDIAILKTSRPMSWVFTKDGFGSVNRVCLPQPSQEYEEGENATVSGWGVMSEGEGTISNVLNAVDVPVISYTECRAAYGQRVNLDHVCAGLKAGGKDSCQGDSGGPLVRKRKNQAELMGIVSFGYGCAQANSPGVYTKVSHYIDWIEKNL